MAAGNSMTTSEWSRQVAEWAEEWHGDLVRFLSRRTRSPADVQDLAQEVYLRLLRVDRHDLIRQPRSYLMRIAANVLYEWRLKFRLQEQLPADVLEGIASTDNPEQGAAAALRRERLSHELGRLSVPVRIALVLQVRDGLSYDQIAAKLNITPRMVKRYLLTAFARLRTRVPSDL
jgi:RNA polymerase sigma factor (sigma-70 family)